MTIQILKRRFAEFEAPAGKVFAKGRYKLIKIKGGIQISETPWFDNLILDSGLNRWGSGAIIAGAAIGTNSTAAAVTDTGLLTQSHYTTTVGTGHNTLSVGTSPDYNNTRTVVYRTTLGALNGSYSEVGVGWVSGSMFSRAIISPSISVASDEQLDIVYQLSIYPPLVDFTDTLNIGGVDYDVTGRASNVTTTSTGSGTYWNVDVATVAIPTISSRGAYAGAIGAITGAPSGSLASGGTVTNNAYTGSSYTRTASISQSISQGNVAGGTLAYTMNWQGWGFQYGFDTAIPKDATKTLVLNFSTTWARR